MRQSQAKGCPEGVPKSPKGQQRNPKAVPGTPQGAQGSPQGAHGDIKGTQKRSNGSPPWKPKETKTCAPGVWGPSGIDLVSTWGHEGDLSSKDPKRRFAQDHLSKTLGFPWFFEAQKPRNRHFTFHWYLQYLRGVTLAACRRNP